MTSTNYVNTRSLFPFSFSAQLVGIISSVIIHAAVIILLFLVSAFKMAPQLQIIQVSLEQTETPFINSPKAVRQVNVATVNSTQSKINRETFSKPLPVQKDISMVSEQSGKVTPALPAEKQDIAEKSNGEVVGLINAENQSDNKTKAAADSKAESRGTAETQFGYMGAPTFIHREMPVYPMLARRLGKEGKVILKLLIDMNGKLQNIEVVEPAGFGFTEAAVAAVKNSTYAPASRNGEKVTTTALLPVRFYLQ
ncbi:MAG: TonB family protein [Smithellaceae bacterium]